MAPDAPMRWLHVTIAPLIAANGLTFQWADPLPGITSPKAARRQILPPRTGQIPSDDRTVPRCHSPLPPDRTDAIVSPLGRPS